MPTAGHGRAERWTLLTNFESAFHDFGLHTVVSRGIGQPSAVLQLIIDTVLGTGNAADQAHRHLRAESRGESNGVLNRVRASPTEVQVPEVGIELFVVGHRGNDAVFQDLDGCYILDADAHRVSREPLGIRNDDLIRSLAESPAERLDLGRRAAATCGSVRLVGHENGSGRHHPAIHAEA